MQISKITSSSIDQEVDVEEKNELETHLELLEDFKNYPVSSDLEWYGVFNKYKHNFSPEFVKTFSKWIITFGQGAEIMYERVFTEEERLKKLIKMNLEFTPDQQDLANEQPMIKMFKSVDSAQLLKDLLMIVANITVIPPLAFSDEVETIFLEIINDSNTK
jgi:hypothetical protein